MEYEIPRMYQRNGIYIKLNRGDWMLKRLKKDSEGRVSLSARKVICTVGAAAFIASTVCGFNYSISRTVTLTDGEKAPIEIKTTKGDIAKVLKENDIRLKNGDKLNFALDTELTDDMVIEIYRAIPVNITYMGETKQYLTTKRTVSEALSELGLAVKETDIFEPAYNESIESGSAIRVVKTAEEVIEVEENIPYKTVKKINKGLNSGESRIAQEGKEGVKVLSYKVSYEDGTEVSRELVGESVAVEAVDEVKEVAPEKPIDNYTVAMNGSVKASRGASLSYSRAIICNASAYDLSYSSCGKNPGDRGYGITASGMRAQYGVVAVDPSVIPLGTKLYIEAVDGSWTYGYAVAGDTGGAIKGNRIDLFFNSNAEAMSFGRRQAKVYVLN